MSDINAGNKVLGLEPAQYVKIAYILVLISSGAGILFGLLAMAGVMTGLAGLTNLLGFIGLIMAVIGWAAFKEKFTPLAISHMRYIVILFLIFLAIGIVLGMALLTVPMAINGIGLLFGIVQFALIFTGFNSWQHGRTVTKDNVQDELKLAIKRA